MVEERSKELSLNWFKAAAHDLDWAEGSFELKKYAGVCFLSQQVVEKTFKAYLYFKGEELKRIHDLDGLLKRIVEHEPQFKRFRQATSTLTGYYLKTRYPDIGDIELFNQEELAKEALTWAKEIFYSIKEKLQF